MPLVVSLLKVDIASMMSSATIGLVVGGLVFGLKELGLPIGCFSSRSRKVSLVGLAIVAGVAIALEALPIKPFSSRKLALLIDLSRSLAGVSCWGDESGAGW
jgi:hypothetical protein